jgi:hypothetical protein
VLYETIVQSRLVLKLSVRSHTKRESQARATTELRKRAQTSHLFLVKLQLAPTCEQDHLHDTTGLVHYSFLQGPAARVKMLSRSILRSTQLPRCVQQTPSPLLLSAVTSYRKLQSPIYRTFATTPRHRKDAARIPQPQSTLGPKAEALESVKPESIQPPTPATAAGASKQDILLAERTVSNAEQRKADWAILKEMTRYLWPKVCHKRSDY